MLKTCLTSGSNLWLFAHQSFPQLQAKLQKPCPSRTKTQLPPNWFRFGDYGSFAEFTFFSILGWSQSSEPNPPEVVPLDHPEVVHFVGPVHEFQGCSYPGRGKCLARGTPNIAVQTNRISVYVFFLEPSLFVAREGLLTNSLGAVSLQGLQLPGFQHNCHLWRCKNMEMNGNLLSLIFSSVTN